MKSDTAGGQRSAAARHQVYSISMFIHSFGLGPNGPESPPHANGVVEGRGRDRELAAADGGADDLSHTLLRVAVNCPCTRRLPRRGVALHLHVAQREREREEGGGGEGRERERDFLRSQSPAAW